MFLYVRSKKIAIALLQILNASVQKLIAWAARQVGFVHPYCCLHLQAKALADCVTLKMKTIQ